MAPTKNIASKKLKENIAYQLTYQVLTVITPLITSPYLSRVLGAESLGVFSSTFAYANYFLMFAMLGAHNYGSKTIAFAGDDTRKLSRTFFSIYAVQCCAAILSCAVYFSSVGLFWHERNRVIIALLQGMWIVACLFDINWFLFGCEKFKVTTIRNIVIKILTIACILIFVKSEKDLPIYVVIMAGGQIISQLVVWPYITQMLHFCVPTWGEIRVHIKPMCKFFVPILAMSVFHVMDKSMLDFLSTDAECGYYYNADRLANIPIGVVAGLNTVMLPRITKMYSIERSGPDNLNLFLGKSFELTLSMSAAIAVGLGAIAPIFVPVFFGSGFEPCVGLIACYVPILIAKSISGFISSQYLIPMNRENIYVFAVIAGAVANLICNIPLIIKYGAVGAAIGSLIAEVIVLLVELIATRRTINFFSYLKLGVPYVLISAVMFSSVRMLVNTLPCFNIIWLLVTILVGSFIFIAGVLVYSRIVKSSLYSIVLRRVK